MIRILIAVFAINWQRKLFSVGRKNATSYFAANVLNIIKKSL